MRAIELGHGRHPWTVWLTIVAVGAGLVLLGSILAAPWSELLRLPGAVALAVCLITVLSWMPENILGKRIDKALERWSKNARSGLYGLVALGMFGLLEAGTLITRIAEFEISLGGLLASYFIRVSVDTILNGVFASIWPIQLVRMIEPGPAIVCALISLAVGRGAQWLLQAPPGPPPPPVSQPAFDPNDPPVDPSGST